MAQKAPIALRALPQQSWGRRGERAAQAIISEWVVRVFQIVLREEAQLGLPQLCWGSARRAMGAFWAICVSSAEGAGGVSAGPAVRKGKRPLTRRFCHQR
jgi:hypothetical protein